MKSLLTFILVFGVAAAFAQKRAPEYRHHVDIGAGQFRFFNVYSNNTIFLTVLQFGYSYKIDKNLYVQGSFGFWRNNASHLPAPNVGITSLFDLNARDSSLFGMMRFRYYDLNVVYKKQLFKRHNLLLAAGPSFATYTSNYIGMTSTIQIPGDPYPHIISRTSYNVDKTAIGILVSVGYKYSFWKERLDVGVSFQGRHYADTRFHCVYGLNVGCNL